MDNKPTFEQYVYDSRGGNLGYGFVAASNKYTEGIPLSKPSASDVGGRTIRLHYSNERIFLVCVDNAKNAKEERISEYGHYFEYITNKPLSKCNPEEYLSAYKLIDTIGNSSDSPISQISCSSLEKIDVLHKKYEIDGERLARFFEGVYRALFWNKKGYVFVISNLLPTQSLEQTSCELMAILHYYMPNMRKRLTFVSNSDGKNIPQFDFCFSRSGKDLPSDNSTEWNYVIKGENKKNLISCFSRAMVSFCFKNSELYNTLISELDDLLLYYDKGDISPSIGEYLFPLVLFSKMPDEYFQQPGIIDELKKPIKSAINALNKFKTENKIPQEIEDLFDECLVRLHEIFPPTNAENMSALDKNLADTGFSIGDIVKRLEYVENLL
ncbi:MAG: hypothetical protein LBM93_01810, partial [Oscillospiraceae bacterium]|nr:hypothetical protein [Oscillospiraceae bacterium]